MGRGVGKQRKMKGCKEERTKMEKDGIEKQSFIVVLVSPFLFIYSKRNA